MSKLLWRLLRLWRQPRIRLPRQLDPEALRPGDRVRIAARWWWIVACSRTASGHDCELISLDKLSELVRLHAGAGGWSLSAGDRMIELTAEDVLHFPVGQELSLRQEARGSRSAYRSR